MNFRSDVQEAFFLCGQDTLEQVCKVLGGEVA